LTKKIGRNFAGISGFDIKIKEEILI
jgi:hypothetical protein